LNKQDKINPSVVLIVGMHRSGTSCCAGSLQEAGLFLGNVNEQAPHNAKGNRENRAIMDLNNDILQANGGSWFDPPSSITWSAEHKARRDELIQEYPTDKIWGFKDPRTLVVIEGWLEALPNTCCVGSFRHPLAVAMSLKQRNKFPREKSLEIWSKYNRLLLRWHSEIGSGLLNFDWSLEQYQNKLSEVALRLNLSPQVADSYFFDLSLRRNYASQDETLGAEVMEIYENLLEIADGPRND
jgi:hypothetical protein